MQDVVKRENSGTAVKRRRKQNMSLHYGTIALIVLVIFAVLSVTVFFNVETIIITGSSIYTADEIVAVTGIEGGDNMVRRNMGKIEEKITSELIYIETAEIKRKFPSSLEIAVSPCEETACFSDGEDGYWIVSQSGKILTSVSEPVKKMPVFYGTEPAEDQAPGVTFASADENKTNVIYELMERSKSGFGSKITSYDVTDRLNISCMYEGRIEIEIGIIADIDYKFRLADEILSSKISPDAEGRLTMLENGAQFLSKSDLEQIEQTYTVNTEPELSGEDPETENGTETEAESETSETTKLNFE